MEPKYNQVAWHELKTKDKDRAIAFYSGIAGWEKKVEPKMDNWVYMAKGEHPACGFIDDSPAEWICYFDVENLDEYGAKIKANGGTQIGNVTPVPSHGRYSHWSDPFGGKFALWETDKAAQAERKKEKEEKESKEKKTRGRKKKEEPPADVFSWHEMQTHNAQATGDFYKAVFGWTSTEKSMGEMGVYTSFHLKGVEQPVGGMMAMPATAERKTNAWLCYIGTEDVEGVTAKAEELKAQVMVKPTVMEEVGTFSVFTDPVGAMCALYCPEKRGTKRKKPAPKKAASPKKAKKGAADAEAPATDGAPADAATTDAAAANGDADAAPMQQ
jgi:predicted enzyme related to lactoylglutathione lyase